MPPMTTAAYEGAKALLERDLAADPAKLQTALSRLDALRVNRSVGPSTCTNCGRALRPAQVIHCSPSCAAEEWNRDEQARLDANARKKAAMTANEVSK